jgi:hypothetical protein
VAGNGPAPKDAAARRRRNAPERGEWQTLKTLERPVLEPLPVLDGEDLWCARTAETWEAWRADPVTGTWSPADRAYAMDTIMLHQMVYGPEGDVARANEVRLRMDSLGLTPKGKRDLRYRLPVDDEDEDSDSGAGKTTKSRRRVPQQRRLRAV